jgi:hypothetical protein
MTSPKANPEGCLLLWDSLEDDAVTNIVITAPIYHCSDCRLLVSNREDWEDHLPDCRRQQKKMWKLSILARGVTSGAILRHASEVCRVGDRRPPIGHSLSPMPYGRGSLYIRNAPQPVQAVSSPVKNTPHVLQ